MNTKIIIVLGIILLGSTGIFAQTKAKFKVYGNCGMCEERIEKAATDVDGVIKASWNSETNKIKVTYDETKVELKEIHKAIAKVGHDTDTEKADDEVYKNLHHCCKYERPKSE